MYLFKVCMQGALISHTTHSDNVEYVIVSTLHIILYFESVLQIFVTMCYFKMLLTLIYVYSCYFKCGVSIPATDIAGV